MSSFSLKLSRITLESPDSCYLVVCSVKRTCKECDWPACCLLLASAGAFVAGMACSSLTTPPAAENISADTAATATAPPARSAAPRPTAPLPTFSAPTIIHAPPPPVPEDVKAAPSTAKKTASGLAYRVLTPGRGTESPKPTSEVEVHYSGWTTDGKMFDSSVTRGSPAKFRVNGVIKGWSEGVQLMTVGEKVRFWIPGDLAYGDHPGGGRPAGMLVFDVELIGIKP